MQHSDDGSGIINEFLKFKTYTHSLYNKKVNITKNGQSNGARKAFHSKPKTLI